MASFGKRDRAQYERDFGEDWILDDADEGLDAAQELGFVPNSYQHQYNAFGAADFGGAYQYHAPLPREEMGFVCDLNLGGLA